jgi:hypothetical protein
VLGTEFVVGAVDEAAVLDRAELVAVGWSALQAATVAHKCDAKTCCQLHMRMVSLAVARSGAALMTSRAQVQAKQADRNVPLPSSPSPPRRSNHERSPPGRIATMRT